MECGGSGTGLESQCGVWEIIVWDEGLEGVGFCALDGFSHIVEVFGSEVWFDECGSEFVVFGVVDEESDGGADSVFVVEGDEFVVAMDGALDVHGDVVDEGEELLEGLGVGAVGVEFDGEASVLDEGDGIEEGWLEGWFSAGDGDGGGPLSAEGVEDIGELSEGVRFGVVATESGEVMAVSAAEVASGGEVRPFCRGSR